MLGAELVEAHPVVPIAEGHALSIGVFSHRDHLFFGLYADPDALPQVRDLPAALGASLLALERAYALRRTSSVQPSRLVSANA
jgi:diacylglycerol O-acyltransferase / wax synthase